MRKSVLRNLLKKSFENFKEKLFLDWKYPLQSFPTASCTSVEWLTENVLNETSALCFEPINRHEDFQAGVCIQNNFQTQKIWLYKIMKKITGRWNWEARFGFEAFYLFLSHSQLSRNRIPFDIDFKDKFLWRASRYFLVHWSEFLNR